MTPNFRRYFMFWIKETLQCKGFPSGMILALYYSGNLRENMEVKNEKRM